MKVEDLPAHVWAKAAHLLEPLQGQELPDPTGWFVLIAQWEKPDKIGNIIMPEVTKQQDKMGGRTGLVLAIGPEAYSKSNKPWVSVGDWVAWPAMENTSCRLRYDGVVLTLLPDDRVVLRGVDPEKVAV